MQAVRGPPQAQGCHDPGARARGAGELSGRSSENSPVRAHSSAARGGQAWEHSGSNRPTEHGTREPTGRGALWHGRAETPSRGVTGEGWKAVIPTHSQGRREGQEEEGAMLEE